MTKVIINGEYTGDDVYLVQMFFHLNMASLYYEVSQNEGYDKDAYTTLMYESLADAFLYLLLMDITNHTECIKSLLPSLSANVEEDNISLRDALCIVSRFDPIFGFKYNTPSSSVHYEMIMKLVDLCLTSSSHEKLMPSKGFFDYLKLFTYTLLSIKPEYETWMFSWWFYLPPFFKDNHKIPLIFWKYKEELMAYIDEQERDCK